MCVYACVRELFLHILQGTNVYASTLHFCTTWCSLASSDNIPDNVPSFPSAGAGGPVGREALWFVTDRCHTCLISLALHCGVCSTARGPGDETKSVVCKTFDSLCAPGLHMSLSSRLLTKKSLLKVSLWNQVLSKQHIVKMLHELHAACLLLTGYRGNCSWQLRGAS